MLRPFSVNAFYVGLSAITLSGPASALPIKQFAPASSISVSAKETGSARNIISYWETSWGSFDRDYLATRDIEIEVHNLSQLLARLVIDFYFVGRPQHLPTPHKLFSKRSFAVKVPPGYQKRLSLQSDILKSHEVRYASLGTRYTSGYEIEGWILFARLPGQVVPFDKVSSSKAMLERMDWFPSALREFENTTHTHVDLALGTESEPPPANNHDTPVVESPSTGPVEPTPPATFQRPVQTTVRTAPAPIETATPPGLFITVIKPTKIMIGRTEEVIQPGTKVQFVARASNVVQVRYKGESAFVNVSSTDLK